jgi:hypothetical protein
MDPITAIGLAIAVIKGGIAIYQMIHDHPATVSDVKVRVAAKIAADTAQVAQLEQIQADWRAELEEKLRNVQAP